jgi:hypothetical protein
VNIGAMTTKQVILDHFKNQQDWKELANTKDVEYVQCVSHRYNDMGVRPQNTRPALARVKLGEPNKLSMFELSINEAKMFDDPNFPKIIVVTSFNEWHENSQVESVVGIPSNEPEELTFGLQYEACGDTYLNTLRRTTSSDDGLKIEIPASYQRIGGGNSDGSCSGVESSSSFWLMP